MAWRIAPSEYKQLTNSEIAEFRAEHERNVEKIKNARRR